MNPPFKISLNIHIMVPILLQFNYFIKLRLQMGIHYIFHITCMKNSVFYTKDVI
jgi:hypothetical protein